jgi:hypothetical protein
MQRWTTYEFIAIGSGGSVALEEQRIQIPFNNFGKSGIIGVIYKENTSPVTSGFEIVKDLVPDLDICIGYPTIRASVKEFAGFGFSRYCGWIQVVQMEFYSDANSEDPDDTYYEVDTTPAMKQKGLPFCAFGYPADFFDAPCNNYYEGAKMVWKANTFLVSMPSYINNESISFLAGFEWGFKEYRSKVKKQINITPVKNIDSEYWEKHIPLFYRDFPQWNFVK